MTLENKLGQLSNLHPFKSMTLTVLEHQTISGQYGANNEDVANYLTYKYNALKQEEKPKVFLLWYVDIHLPKYDKK